MLFHRKNSPYQYCEELYNELVHSTKREVALLSLKPNHTFFVLIDETGNQLLMNSHIIYKKTTDTFHMVIGTEASGASAMHAPTSSWKEMLHFILESYPQHVHADVAIGEMISILPKN